MGSPETTRDDEDNRPIGGSECEVTGSSRGTAPAGAFVGGLCDL